MTGQVVDTGGRPLPRGRSTRETPCPGNFTGTASRSFSLPQRRQNSSDSGASPSSCRRQSWPSTRHCQGSLTLRASAPPARPQGTKAKRTTRAYCRIPASDDAPVIGIHERGLFVKLSLSGIGWLWGGVVCGAGQQAARAAGEGRSGAVLSRLVGDADRAAGAVGCSVVVSASAQESRATAARAARHSFACGDCMKPSGALGVQGRGAIHFLDRTGWWVMPFPGPHEDCCVTPPRRG